MGLIGANGAGKSTLLRLIAQVGRPDSGTVEVRGRMSALLDLGAGFHPDLTGRENVFLGGVISGYTRREVRRRLDEIVAFAELESFIDNPLRTYSTGMRLRLAFSVAALTEPEILIIDEVLAVGDLAFQHKCVLRIQHLKGTGCTMLVCSHDPGLIRELCDTAAWLDAGRVASVGAAEAVLDSYIHALEAND
jgi:lipopolysaccharide transport system ATP-binding protein